ncbi:uncharacterized protein LOC111310705 [Durio zibethinus]|uniref:Uncharacterized protein LOC111310705 n=1 Tax=Durio zibethinus TaxID=66656 RepID=A0A6P6AM26_DURZI|nr:uncharacterized protein LOC111310705 [Durio zibethinus]
MVHEATAYTRAQHVSMLFEATVRTKVQHIMTVFDSSAKDSTRRSMGIELQGGPRGSSATGAAPTTRALRGHGPLLRDKTNLSDDGLNPAHVPYWWVNNPTLGEFCFIMIGKADIEGSKSNVAMNAWLPQASYPCGSIGHAFMICIRTENQNQTSFYPFVTHEIFVLIKLILGHLCYLLTDVPPQPNSPPEMSSTQIDQLKPALSSKEGVVPRL